MWNPHMYILTDCVHTNTEDLFFSFLYIRLKYSIRRRSLRTIVSLLSTLLVWRFSFRRLKVSVETVNISLKTVKQFSDPVYFVIVVEQRIFQVGFLETVIVNFMSGYFHDGTTHVTCLHAQGLQRFRFHFGPQLGQLLVQQFQSCLLYTSRCV